MKSDLIKDEPGICKVVHYIHTNPVHHGFVKDISEWKFSSYNTYLSQTATKLAKQAILDIFGSKEYFIKYHRQPIELKWKWDV